MANKMTLDKGTSSSLMRETHIVEGENQFP